MHELSPGLQQEWHDGVTWRVGTTYPYRIPEFTPGFDGINVDRSVGLSELMLIDL